MSSSLNLVAVTTMANKEQWQRFSMLARSQGQTISALLRQMVARELRLAAKAAEK